MYQRSATCRRLLAVCGLVSIMGPSAAAKPPPRFTRAQEIDWHLKQAREFRNRDRMDDARLQWFEVHRLDPGNQEALLGLELSGVSIPGSPRAAEHTSSKIDATAISGSVREAVRIWASATDLTGIGDILTDRTADPFGKRLTRAFRLGIMSADASVNYSPDPELFDEFESFIDSTNLTPVINELSDSRTAGDSGRPYGRDLIHRLQKFERRAMLSGVEIGIIRPFGIDHAANDLNKIKLTIVSPTRVLIDDPDFENAAPLEARLEEGKWRIGARPGYTLFYDVKILRGTHRQFRAR